MSTVDSRNVSQLQKTRAQSKGLKNIWPAQRRSERQDNAIMTKRNGATTIIIVMITQTRIVIGIGLT